MDHTANRHSIQSHTQHSQCHQRATCCGTMVAEAEAEAEAIGGETEENMPETEETMSTPLYFEEVTLDLRLVRVP